MYAKYRLPPQSEGKAEGKAEDILHILRVRGVEVPDSVRERVVGCTDLDVLGTWLDRSLSATHAEELFVGEWGVRHAKGARRIVRRAPSVVATGVTTTASR
ncbi:hypothetical protein SUDANB174_03180 [Streptomyces sp. enrichment culture]